MKRRLFPRLMLLCAVVSFTGLFYSGTAKAEEISGTEEIPVVEEIPVGNIELTKYPSKLTYNAGEELELSDMILTGYYSDGTQKLITDYTVEGYDSKKIGEQIITIRYQNQSKGFMVTVKPAKVTNVSVINYSPTSFTLTWDAFDNISRYEVYRFDENTGSYTLLGYSTTNSIPQYYSPGTIHKFQVCAVGYINQIEYKGELSDPFTAAMGPEMITGLAVTGTTENTISLSWNAVNGATGYLIYRTPSSTQNYTLIGTSDTVTYTDSTPASGTGYQYKVSAYLLDPMFYGNNSSPVDITTNPAKMVLKFKAGDGKVRIGWNKIIGATSYDLYQENELGEFTLLTSLPGNLVNSYVLEDLTNGNTYSFNAIAHRTYNGVIYDSPVSDTLDAQPAPVEATSTVAKLFPKLTDFESSAAYTGIEFFKTNVNLKKSFILPGQITTNVGGFSSVAMCPQGITFAKNYLLMTAYDLAGEENSVIYVMNKKTGKLLTTLILPTKAHVGGISYDGSNIWVTNGTKISTIPYSKIATAAAEGNPYTYLEFSAVCDLGVTASFTTFYDNMLWVGSYNELKETYLYSYTIEYEEEEPYLSQEYSILLPTRVQGVAFTKEGYLILSRSCQLYKGLRGYIRQLDVYRPDFSQEIEDGEIEIGDLINTVEMPSMNEEIAIDGSYLYVNFESAAFDKASYRVDRICAFKLTSVLTKPAKE